MQKNKTKHKKVFVASLVTFLELQIVSFRHFGQTTVILHIINQFLCVQYFLH